jgi:hypothetical protein
MKVTWDLKTPIEALFEQIVDGAAYADTARNPFATTQLVLSALLCLQQY